jgi:glycosyltransferase involved in cell wall biosynthesis
VKIQIVTDAWTPSVSGVVRTFLSVAEALGRAGHQVRFITPDMFRTIRCPTDTHLRLAVNAPGNLGRIVEDTRADAIHVATEGPLGITARLCCSVRRIPFTTSYTTHMPEYFRTRLGLPAAWTYPLMRWFHRPAAAVMVATERLRSHLEQRGFRNLVRWNRGVDTSLFRPGPKTLLDGPRPALLYVGRVAPEKNVEAFLDLPVAGTKYVVGDGPAKAALERRYRNVRFLGSQHGPDLARHYAAADVVVFPSRLDTFGLVLLEALACGVPVAAYPVPGPLDVIGDSGAGALDDDLARAVRRALEIPPTHCRAFARQFSWDAVAEQFLLNLAPIDWSVVRAPPLVRPRVELAGPHFRLHAEHRAATAEDGTRARRRAA